MQGAQNAADAALKTNVAAADNYAPATTIDSVKAREIWTRALSIDPHQPLAAADDPGPIPECLIRKPTEVS
jgi:hypothetical protein